MEESEDPGPHKHDRRLFYEPNFSELDRDLTPEERKEWDSIYASYRGRSSLRGTIIGMDQHSVKRWDRQTGESLIETMYCAIVIPYRIRVVILESELWVEGAERPQYMLQNMVGATVDFITLNLPDETVCLCNYSYQHGDSKFQIGDTVILIIQRHNLEKKLIFGKILTLWHTEK